MICPVCEGRMRTVTKHGVEVDICPDCKGVWLDRGELDKIIEMVDRGGSAAPEQRADTCDRERERPQESREHRGHDHEREHDHDRGYRDDRHGIDPTTGRPRRRESLLGQIFEAFGGGDD